MVEPIMYLAIGFLLSMLAGLMLLPLVHNRAVRLTTRRLEAATPVSMSEIQAEKDQLRAEFAMSARRLEMSVEQLKSKSIGQMAELGKKSDAINRMKLELGEQSATIFSLESREQDVREKLRTVEEEFASKTETIRAAEAALNEKQAELARVTDELADRSMTADTRQVELLALRTEIDALKQRNADNEPSHDTAQFVQRVQELEAGLAIQHRLLAERDNENARLRETVALASGNDSRETIAETDSRLTAAADAQRRMTEDRDRLQRELNAMQQQTENTWATERMENALLRERINDIAAEVAKLALTLEGPNSTIGEILAAAPHDAAYPVGDAGPEHRATLADRIRALQSRPPRAHGVT